MLSTLRNAKSNLMRTALSPIIKSVGQQLKRSIWMATEPTKPLDYHPEKNVSPGHTFFMPTINEQKNYGLAKQIGHSPAAGGSSIGAGGEASFSLKHEGKMTEYHVKGTLKNSAPFHNDPYKPPVHVDIDSAESRAAAEKKGMLFHDLGELTAEEAGRLKQFKNDKVYNTTEVNCVHEQLRAMRAVFDWGANIKYDADKDRHITTQEFHARAKAAREARRQPGI